MSKGKVWNRGKHNGKGLPPRKEYKEQTPTIKSNLTSELAGAGSQENVIPTRVNTVQRMNRDNWVQRATPLKREDKTKS
jgi:hypothetical protein